MGLHGKPGASPGPRMAIYSLHHSSIGKSTQERAHTAAAHVDYITRKRAVSRAFAGRMPTDKEKAMAFLRASENKLRKNGRVADKLMLALPRELSADQREALVRDFAEEITRGRASWYGAVHDKGKDQKNPHCHLLVVDRDVTTGRRVFGTSEKGSTERLRQLWEAYANAALARAGRAERIDRRTLEAQGLKRKPTIHVGVRSSQLVGRNRPLVSRDRAVRNHCQARTRQRTVAYPVIDKGKLRLAHNIDIRRANMFASRGGEGEKAYWAAIDQDAFLRDIRELKRLNAVLVFGPDGVTPIRSRDEGRGGPDLDL